MLQTMCYLKKSYGLKPVNHFGYQLAGSVDSITFYLDFNYEVEVVDYYLYYGMPLLEIKTVDEKQERSCIIYFPELYEYRYFASRNGYTLSLAFTNVRLTYEKFHNTRI